MTRIDEARSKYDMRHILGVSKKRIVCPLPTHIHANNTPSFSIFWRNGVQHFKCHGNCGLTGDVVDLVGYINIPGYDRHNADMVNRALDLMDNRLEISPPFVPEKQPKLDPYLWRKLMPPGERVIQYAKKRGLTEDTIEKFFIGQYKNWMSMPIFENGKLVNVKLRNTGEGQRFMSVKGSRISLFNHDAVAYTTETVYVVKGEIPAMLMDQMGFLACAPSNGEGALSDHIKEVLAFANVIVVGDNDVQGRKLGYQRAIDLEGKIVFPPDEYKDLDEFILAVSDAGNIIKGWAE